jgi:hypothetical protein
MATDTDLWFPLFEFQDWIYQSFLILPTTEGDSALPGAAVTAKKWAEGEFLCGQAFNTDGGYTLDGRLSFRPGVELEVSVKGTRGLGNAPASFEATGTGMKEPTKGSLYQLVGWVFPDEPIRNGAAKPLSIRGSVWAVRGPDTKPETELGGMPAKTTVGTFVIVSRGPA